MWKNNTHLLAKTAKMARPRGFSRKHSGTEVKLNSSVKSPPAFRGPPRSSKHTLKVSPEVWNLNAGAQRNAQHIQCCLHLNARWPFLPVFFEQRGKRTLLRGTNPGQRFRHGHARPFLPRRMSPATRVLNTISTRHRPRKTKTKKNKNGAHQVRGSRKHALQPLQKYVVVYKNGDSKAKTTRHAGWQKLRNAPPAPWLWWLSCVY